MAKTTRRTLWRVASLTVLAVGLLLIAFMVRTEGELGALPLGLALLGAISSIAAWRTPRGA